jgi:hypothetical protein
LGPPRSSTRAPGVTGASERISASTRSCASTEGTRTSTATRPIAGMVFVLVPADIRVGVTDTTPARDDESIRLATSVIARIWWASSTPAFTPFSGSRPACAALPYTMTS